MKTNPITVEEWSVGKVHAFELPVSIAIAMAIQNGFIAVHFHCCNVALHIQTYAVHAEEHFPDPSHRVDDGRKMERRLESGNRRQP